MKWITLSPGIDVRATKNGYVIRAPQAILFPRTLLISNDVLEKLREQEWQLDISESKRK